MALDAVVLQAWLLNHAGTVVGTPAVLGYEPKSRLDYDALGSPTVFAGWFSSIEACQTRAGLATAAARLEWVGRLHRNALGPAADQEATERALLTAVDALVAAMFGDLDIAGAGWFDPRGQTGEPMKATTGYLELDKQLNRVSTITVGIVVDDAWGEVL